MDDGFSQERVRLIRELAAKADSFTKRTSTWRGDTTIPTTGPLNDVPHPLANLPSVELIACKASRIADCRSSSGISQARSG
jgi:hypothetical protein